jgi:hypothetical protein
MVICDSLAQGCRSLSVKADYCAQSWPARIAAAQKWEFITPDFSREVLFDLEKEIRLLDTLSVSLDKLTFSNAVSRIQANLRAWLDECRSDGKRALLQPGGSQHLCFDNLGLTGAAIYDLYPNPAKGRCYDEALISAIVSSPRVMRQMPRLLSEAGLEFVASFQHVLAEIGNADFWLSALESFRKLIPKAGAMSEEETAGWVDGLLEDSRNGVFFGACNYYSYIATRPSAP